MDFEQLAFIEKWRRRAARGVIVALDGRSGGGPIVTMRVGELGERMDLRGRDATGALRKARLTLGDRITMAIEYVARDVTPGMGASVTGDLVAPGAIVEGSIVSTGELTVVDCGVEILVRGDTLPGVSEGDVVRFAVADEGSAYYIPTR
ncbi:MAG: hypothetical protein HY071_06810 [Chloroflexi bacterium]|nr:hypothetical protein [Chloroflexota bacterium]